MLIPDLNLHDGNVASTPAEKASALNSFFATCFNRSCPPLTSEELPTLHALDCPTELLCTEDEVFEMLYNLDTSKASGPDGISGMMLKHTASSIGPILTKLFNLSITTGKVPTAWKMSAVVPIPKSKDSADPSNYRPISLLSVCSKMLERHISNILAMHLSNVCPISGNQWGFTPKKSTTTALLSVVHDWHQHLEQGNEVCTVFFDLHKAFDSVPHQPLIHKLEELGVDKYLLKWISNYLTERKQQVVVNGETSSALPVTSGVPQGSVLGPLLFIFYVDGVESVTLSDGTVVMFADDMVLYRPIHAHEDYLLLQRDINAIASWIARLHLQFSENKCKYMILSRKRSGTTPPAILLNDLPLQRVSEYKYLGVYISSDLSWSLHISTICNKARKLVGMFHRRFFSIMDVSTNQQLYVSYIRPHLEYACQVWDPHMKKDIEALEAVQKFALRACTKLWDTPYQTLLSSTNLPDLAARRRQMKLCTLYKLIHGHADFPNLPVTFRENYHELRNSNTYSVAGFRARTNGFAHSFFPLTTTLWNNLTPDVVVLPYPSFKRLISR